MILQSQPKVIIRFMIPIWTINIKYINQPDYLQKNKEILNGL